MQERFSESLEGDPHGDQDALRAFMAEVQRHPLLSREEEIELATIIKYSKPKGRVKEARDRLIQSNLRLVVFFAWRMKPMFPNTPISDLIQSGVTGLIRAVEKFDVDLGYKFSTYCAPWIRQGIFRCGQHDRLIRIPSYQQEKVVTIGKMTQHAKQKLGTESLTVEEIAHFLGWDVEDVRSIMSTILTFTSIDAPIKNEKGTEDLALIDIIPSDNPSAESLVEQSSIAEHVRKMVDELLDPREKRILYKRYGIGGEDPSSLSQIGRDLNGVSRERVRQIKLRAEQKLKEALSENDAA